MSDTPAQPPIWPPPPGQTPPGQPPPGQMAPGGPPPPAGWTPPAWPPPPGQRTGPRWYVIVAIVVGGLIVMGTAAALLIPKAIKSVLGPRTGAIFYLTAVRRGDTQGGYEFLCAQTRAEMSYEQYASQIAEQQAEVGRVTRFSVTKSTVEVGSNTGSAEFTVHTDRGKTFHGLASMHKEGVLWRWCGSGPAPRQIGVSLHFP